jgi:hypothetical protein
VITPRSPPLTTKCASLNVSVRAHWYRYHSDYNHSSLTVKSLPSLQTFVEARGCGNVRYTTRLLVSQHPS